MTCLDVGARSGFVSDLLPIASAVNACGFEPDATECARLNANAEQGHHRWRSLRYLPVALGRSAETRELKLYRRRGCSSLLDADQQVAANFCRGDYYVNEGVASVDTLTLDGAAEQYGLTDAVYIKIDIQGGELEVFKSGSALLGSMLAVRSEVSFIPVYKNQPLFGDVDALVRAFGFVPMGFTELHHWRRTTKTKHPALSNGLIPYSKGQVVHGDILYFRDPSQIKDRSEDGVGSLIKAALLAIAHEYIDHAAAIFARPAVSKVVRGQYAIDTDAALQAISRRVAKRDRRRRFLKAVIGSKQAALDTLRLL